MKVYIMLHLQLVCIVISIFFFTITIHVCHLKFYALVGLPEQSTIKLLWLCLSSIEGKSSGYAFSSPNFLFILPICSSLKGLLSLKISFQV